MPDFELAQLNIAQLAAPLESPALKDFVDNLERINQLAEEAPGYVWRFQTEDGNATAVRPFGEDYLVNFSLWKDIESLQHYVYRSAHAKFLRRRKEWFYQLRVAYTVLWWVPRGHRPTIAEAKEKLQLLRVKGPTPAAFTFKKPFQSPSQTGSLSAARQHSCPAT